MFQIKIFNVINIFLFLKYDDIKLKCNYIYSLLLSNIRHSTDGRSNVKNLASDRRALDVEYSTFNCRAIECQNSDIRSEALRISNIRHSYSQRRHEEYLEKGKKTIQKTSIPDTNKLIFCVKQCPNVASHV